MNKENALAFPSHDYVSMLDDFSTSDVGNRKIGLKGNSRRFLLYKADPPPRLLQCFKDDVETCSLELSCTQCWSECDVSAGNASVNPRDTIPSCEELPTGVRHVSEGATPENFHLEKGYYRTSNKSIYVRECYREGSCKGGDDASNYCARGYEGPCEWNTCYHSVVAHVPYMTNSLFTDFY